MKVLITGASSGLGEGLALHYGGAGAVVGLVARRADLLAELAKKLEAAGAKPVVTVADVIDTAAMARAADEFVQVAGGVDLVIANAGIGIAHETLAGKSAPIARLMQVNVVGVTNTLIPFVPHMIERGSGTLAAVSSIAGFRGLPGRAAYSASKAAVITFMDALRLELLGTGVHAMSLCPGFVSTPLTATLPGKLPFVIPCDEAVRLMARAIEKRKKTYVFPRPIRVLASVLRHAPEGFVRRFAPTPRMSAPS